MSFTNYIKDKLRTTEDSNIVPDNLSDNTIIDSESNDDLNSELSTSTKDETEILQQKEVEAEAIKNNDLKVINSSGDSVIDDIREHCTYALAEIQTANDINPSDKSVSLKDTLYLIFDTLIDQLVTFSFDSSSILNLNKIYDNIDTFNYKYITNFKSIKKLPYIKGEGFPEFSTMLDNFNLIFDEEYHATVKKFNYSLQYISTKEYLGFTNNVGVYLMNLFNSTKAINFVQKFKYDDLKYDKHWENIYYNQISQLPGTMKSYLKTYDILSLDKVISSYYQIINIDETSFSKIVDSKNLKLFTKIKQTVNNLNTAEFPQSVLNLISNISNSTLIDELSEIQNIQTVHYVLKGLEKQIRYLSNALAVAYAKNGTPIPINQFEKSFLSYKDAINKINPEEIYSKIEEIISQIDQDIINLKPQIAYDLKPIDDTRFGLPNDFIKLVQDLINLNKLYKEGIDKVNNISVDGALAAFLYPALNLLLDTVKPKVVKISKLLKSIQTADDLNQAANISKINDILNDKDLIPIINEIKKYMQFARLTFNTDEFENDLLISDQLFNTLHSFKSNIDKLNQEFPMDLQALQNIPNNKYLLETMYDITSKLDEVLRNIFTIGTQYNNVVNEYSNLFLNMKKYNSVFTGFNILSKCDFTYIKDNMMLYTVIANLDLPEIGNLTLPDFELDIDSLIEIRTDYELYLKSKYSAVVNAANAVGVKLPSFENIDLLNISLINENVKDLDVKFTINKFIREYSLYDSIRKLSTYSPTSYNVEDVNSFMSAFHTIKYNLNGVSDTDFEQAIYYAEEFKNELTIFSQNLPDTLNYSRDVFNALNSNLAFLSIDNIDSLISFSTNFMKYSKISLDFIEIIESKIGQLDKILHYLATSPQIEMTSNSIKFVFDSDDLTTFKIYTDQILSQESNYIGVKNMILDLKKNYDILIIELDSLKEIANMQSKEARDVLKATPGYQDTINQEDWNRSYIPANVYANLLIKDKMYSLIGETVVNYDDYNILDDDGNVIGFRQDDYNEAIITQGKLEYFNVNSLNTQIDSIKNKARAIQNQMSLVYGKSAFRMRTTMKAYTENSNQSSILKKVANITKVEDRTYKNMINGAQPLEPQKYALDPLLTYDGQNENYNLFETPTCSYITATKISDEFLISQTEYLMTTIDNNIVQIVKVYKKISRVYGVTGVKFAGYGYYDKDSQKIKYSPQLKLSYRMFDTREQISKHTVSYNSKGFLNSTHQLFTPNSKTIMPLNYNLRTNLGFSDLDGNIYIRNNQNLDVLDPSAYSIISPNNFYNIIEYEGTYTKQGGVNNELQKSKIYKTTTQLGEKYHVFKDGIYQIIKIETDDAIEYTANYSKLAFTSGMIVDTSRELQVSMNGINYSAYRINSPFYSTFDYFLALYDPLLKKYKIISPRMLDDDHYFKQHVFELSLGNYDIFDHTSNFIKNMLGLKYNPKPAVESFNYNSNLYKLEKEIQFNGNTYYSVVDLTLNEVAFTDNQSLIFNEQFNAQKEIDVYGTSIETCFITNINT